MEHGRTSLGPRLSSLDGLVRQRSSSGPLCGAVLFSGLRCECERQQLGDVACVIEAAMVRAGEWQADHLQRAGHAHIFDLPGFGELPFEVDVLEAGQRVRDAVPCAISGKLLGVVLAPAPPLRPLALMQLARSLANRAATSGNSGAPSTSACVMPVRGRQKGVSRGCSTGRTSA